MAASWHTLPFEIRDIILGLICSNTNRRTTSRFASVSREWQMYFEPILFRRLVLGQRCIRDFGRIVRQHRRSMVEHIWLRVELFEYNCPRCECPEKPSEAKENNQIFTAVLYRLLEVLSTWSKGGQHGVANGGFVLELSVHSPSDTGHHFNYPFGKEVYPNRLNEQCTIDEYRAYVDVATRRPLHSLHGLENITLEHMIHDYPSLNKNAQRRFDIFLRNLGSLKSLSIYGDHKPCQENRYQPYGMLPFLGRTLADESHSFEHLSVAFLADAKDFFHDFWPGYSPTSIDISRSGVQRALFSRLPDSQRQALGNPRKSFVYERRLLREYKLVYGNEKIPCSIYKPQWPNLESLALTSSLLQKGTEIHAKAINHLLQAAAAAAMEMPKLQTMEIFNKGFSDVFVFQYCRSLEGLPTITLSSTWRHVPASDVLKAWDLVAHKHTGREIELTMKGLRTFFFKSHGAVVSILKLRRLILHPVSLCQFVYNHDYDLNDAFTYKVSTRLN
ncbi:hypothetical protein Trco_006490 [Trichoderma cornu-damae]|uniref:DUF6546 domain-containing protein n=1 Tax=Trichoderma cornu-damae TaxID=654480 RepID=A0A9P8QLA1_9HYPO|nr:hypothetical protein Trco_006490 [Trichoderma cornu-damae]